jgi:two-component system chemotaxis response regulator CheY
MMPEMDGHQALREIRGMEAACGIATPHRAIAFMTTAVDDETNVAEALRAKCDAYLLKPIDKRKLLDQMYACKLLPDPDVS